MIGRGLEIICDRKRSCRNRGGYTPGCFGEQIANKGLAGKECKRVRKQLKTIGLLGSRKTSTEVVGRLPRECEGCAAATRGVIRSAKSYHPEVSQMGAVLSTDIWYSNGYPQGAR